MAGTWDAIVVGGRVAGAPTAMLLARQGHRVLLVDRAKFPSDTISTHLLHPTGVAAMERWGLREPLAETGCPPIDTYRIDFECAVLTGTPPPTPDGIRYAYGPRRIVLDDLLVRAAADAGVEVRQGFSVDEVLMEEGQAVGVRGRSGGGAPIEERAKVVIGADGKHSTVLKAVGDQTYKQRPKMTAGYYAYWSGLPIKEFRVYVRPHRAIVTVPTHDDQTLVLVGWPQREFADHKGDVEGEYLRTIASVPEMADLIAGGHRETRFVGTGDMLNEFRKPFGPGWALVGDAGYVKDPCTAQGISDSFRDAELLATALHESFTGETPYEKSMLNYQTTRDRAVKRMFNFTCMLAPMDPLPAFVRLLFASMEGNQPAMDRFMGVFAGTVPVWKVFNPLHSAGVFGSRLVHGRRQSPAIQGAFATP